MVANLELWGILLRTPLELRGIILITYLENLNQQVGVERRSLSFILGSLELSRDWSYPETAGEDTGIK